MGGAGGRRALPSGSPRSYTAGMDLWHRGPSRAPVPHVALAWPLAKLKQMMAMPLGYRVSGLSSIAGEPYKEL